MFLWNYFFNSLQNNKQITAVGSCWYPCRLIVLISICWYWDMKLVRAHFTSTGWALVDYQLCIHAIRPQSETSIIGLHTPKTYNDPWQGMVWVLIKNFEVIFDHFNPTDKNLTEVISKTHCICYCAIYTHRKTYLSKQWPLRAASESHLPGLSPAPPPPHAFFSFPSFLWILALAPAGALHALFSPHSLPSSFGYCAPG